MSNKENKITLCNCRKEIEQKVFETCLKQEPTLIRENVRFNQINLLTGITYNQCEISIQKGKRTFKESMYLEHSFCPFCGHEFKKKEELCKHERKETFSSEINTEYGNIINVSGFRCLDCSFQEVTIN